MYAVANVKKFIEDNSSRLGQRGNEILKRAEKLSHEGVISGGSVEEIMDDASLTREFHESIMNSPEHVEIGLSAIRNRMK